MRFADLHLHTVCSDGTYTPEEIVEISAQAGLSCIAVCDHDTTKGIEPCILSAGHYDLEVVPAVELSCEFDAVEIHILGYLINHKDETLAEKLDFLKQKRLERIHKMIDNLREYSDVNIDAKEVEELAGGGTISRLHLARILIKKGYVNSIHAAFQKYIGEKSPAHVCGFHFTPAQAIRLIKDTKGIPVLAHPYSINRDDLIPRFVDYGLQGIEVYYPEHSANQTIYYENLAKKYNLLLTGGSDCHGNVKPQVKIGAVKIPYELVQRLKEAKERVL